MNPAARDNFRQQAEWCVAMGSPFTALVCRTLHDHLTEDSGFGRRLLDWSGKPDADAVALRACGALNALARSGDRALAPLYPPNQPPSDEELWRAARDAISREDLALTAFLDSPPQTNEVSRSAALLPGYLAIARLAGLPLAIREIGASAGLNLFFDRYSYDYGPFGWGESAARTRIACEWRGPKPDLAATIDVADRKGCDRSPIDARDPAARARMLAYIWPDQAARLARAESALDLVAGESIEIEATDAAQFAARELKNGASGHALVLAHSIFWQYLADATKTNIRAMVTEAAARATNAAPFAWLRMEAEAEERRGAVLRLSLWPRGPVDEALAVVDFHGRWLEWRSVV